MADHTSFSGAFSDINALATATRSYIQVIANSHQMAHLREHAQTRISDLMVALFTHEDVTEYLENVLEDPLKFHVEILELANVTPEDIETCVHLSGKNKVFDKTTQSIVNTSQHISVEYDDTANPFHLIYAILLWKASPFASFFKDHGLREADIEIMIHSGGHYQTEAEMLEDQEACHKMMMAGDNLTFDISEEFPNVASQKKEKPKLITNMCAIAQEKPYNNAELHTGIFESIERTLLRQKKPNILLIGQPGIGKTSILETLADRLVSGQIHPYLREHVLYEAHISRILENSPMRGALEANIESIIQEMTKKSILFFDEMHTMIGAGRSGENPTDIAQLLKPSLARGAFCCIGVTTQSEFDQYLQKDPALLRRFHIIKVAEPTAEETIALLHKVGKDISKQTKISIHQNNYEAIIDHTRHALPKRFWPDKALDVLDDVIAEARLQNKRRITNSMIAQSVARMTGTSEKHTISTLLPNLASDLKKHIAGQDAIIDGISEKINRSLLGLSDPKTPRGRFLFTGPTGTGKTEMARALSKILKRPLLKIDMSEYQEEHSIARLIGSPPGYLGSEKPGFLTNAIEEKPNSIILFDEIDKANPRLQTLFLQLLDEGILTDGQNKTCCFRNTIVIMTANTGGHLGADIALVQRQDNKVRRIEKAINERFLPEIRARIDGTYTFAPMNALIEERAGITMFNTIRNAILHHHGIQLTIPENFIASLLAIPYKKTENARSTRKHVENIVATALTQWLSHNTGEKPKKLALTIKGDSVKVIDKTFRPSHRRCAVPPATPKGQRA